MDTVVCHPDDISYHHMSSGWLSWNWYLIRMNYDNVIMSSWLHTLPFLSYPDEIANFDFHNKQWPFIASVIRDSSSGGMRRIRKHCSISRISVTSHDRCIVSNRQPQDCFSKSLFRSHQRKNQRSASLAFVSQSLFLLYINGLTTLSTKSIKAPRHWYL